MPHLQPKRYSRIYPRTLGVRPGYGERRRARERARHPLFADLDGWLESAETYDAQMADENQRYVEFMRQNAARDWRIVRRWLEQSDDAASEAFWRQWRYLPHGTEYALTAIRLVERRRLLALLGARMES